MNDKKIMNRAADNIRILAASMVEKAKSGHPGGAMGGADFINVLFSEFMVWDPDNLTWEGRDRFFLDPGHMSPMLYSALALQGKFTIDELKQFRQWESPTPGHPERDVKRGVENTSGPLGQGHTFAAGAAVAEKFLQAKLGSEVIKHKIYAYISDGGVQEEISQGVGRIAGNLGLNNLIMFYDSNDIQLSTECNVVMNEDTAAKYKAWGWNVVTIDGNDPDAIRQALTDAQKEEERPTLIIGKTIMGKGALKEDGSSYEHSIKTHGAPLGGEAYVNTIKNLGGDPENPFVIFPEVEKLYADRAEELRKIVAERHAEEEAWAKANPEKAAQMKEWFSGNAPKVDWSVVSQKEGSATRAASAACLGALAEQVPNMVCSSADLSNSDKTDGFLKKTHSIVCGDFSGAFFQAGVSELTMACMCIGMYLHGGVIPACGTFFVFSDYIKPALRMSALMELPVKYIFTHDAFRVGEDGPTHQPVEQEAQIRLMELLDNFGGRQSTLVLRPADSAETAVAWKMAMDNKECPTVLILSRQNLEDLPAADGNRCKAAYGAQRGGYTVIEAENPELILVANGSEVALAVHAAEALAEEGRSVRVVSVPSVGLFLRQDKEYRDSVLTPGIPRYGITAGLPAALYPLMRGTAKWDVFGLEHFGASAPYKVLDEKFGFNDANVLTNIIEFIES